MFPKKSFGNRTISSLFIGLIMLILSQRTSGQNRHALIVAVQSYNQIKYGWRPLHTSKDTLIMKEALLKQGFKTENIHVVFDGKRQDIMDGMKKYMLNNKAISKGDVFFLHFSCHGQQVPDLDGDEPDGMDEAIVPIDAPASYHYQKDYKYDLHITDDDIETILNPLRKKLGKKGSVLLLVDACHSSTMSRGQETSDTTYTRGTHYTWEIDEKNVKSIISRNKSRNNFGLMEETVTADVAELFCLYGSSQFESNIEYAKEACGSATYSFAKYFRDANKGTTYRMLYESMANEMATVCEVPNRPQFEGDADKIILSNKFLETPSFFRTIDLTNSPEIVIDGGSFHLLEPGQRVAIYPKDTYDTTVIRYSALGTIKKCNLSYSLVKPDSEIQDTLASYWIFPVTKPKNLKKAHIKYSGSYNGECDLVNKLHTSSFISSSNTNWNIEVIEKPRYKDTITFRIENVTYDIADSEGHLLFHNLDERSLFTQLERMGRGIFLKSLTTEKTENPSVEFSIHTVGLDVVSNNLIRKGRLERGLSWKEQSVTLTSKDTVALSVLDTRVGINNEEPLHYFIFEIKPDFTFQLSSPAQNRKGERIWIENQLNRGNSTPPDLCAMTMSEPYGTYSELLFLSKSPNTKTYIESNFSDESIEKQVNSYFADPRSNPYFVKTEITLPKDLEVLELKYIFVK